MSAYFFDAAVWVNHVLHEAQFARDEGGYEQFDAWLLQIGAALCWVGIEHTGKYERDLAEHLLSKGHKVSLLDGGQVHEFKKSQGKKAKTDKIDARQIAKYVRTHRPAIWNPLPEVHQRLLALKKHRDDLVAAITEWNNRRNAPVSNEFVRAQNDAVVQVLKLQKEAVEEQIAVCVRSDAELKRSVDRAQELTGIAFTTAAAFLAESGPINRKTYPTPESLSLSAGMAPLPSMSGVSAKGTYRRPYGNLRLRACLNMSASVAKRHDPALKVFAQRMQARGKTPAQQTKAVKRKMIHLLWAVIVNDEPYDPAKAIKNFPAKNT